MFERPVYTCYRAANPIVIDGHLDDPSWAGAPAIALRLADAGGVPVQATTARMLWDDDYFYVAFECVDAHIYASLTAPKAHLWEEEVVEVFIDDDCDGKGYAEFEINPLNAVLDLYILKRGTLWRQLWDWTSFGIKTAVVVDGDPTRRDSTDRSWTVEIAIPMSDFMTAPHVPPQAGESWLVNLYRYDRPPQGVEEHSAWSPVGPASFHTPERFGQVVFSDKQV